MPPEQGGERFNATLGQYYLRARFYDPKSGRFGSMDPFAGNLGDPLQVMRYGYAGANPVWGMDPTGEMTIGVAGLTVQFSFGKYLAGTVLTGYLLGKAFSAASLLIQGKSLRDMQLFEMTDLFALIPGGVLVGGLTKFVVVSARLVTTVAAKSGTKIIGNLYQAFPGFSSGAHHFAKTVFSAASPSGTSFATKSGLTVGLKEDGTHTGLVLQP